MKAIGLIWTIIIWANSLAEAGNTIAMENGNQIYIEVKQEFTWFEAIDKCTQLNMSLISMDFEKKALEVNKLITTNSGTTFYNLWIGGHDHNISRHFEWITTGEAFGYTNWRSSYPDNAAYHCVFMRPDISFKWADYDCKHKMGFVCEETPEQKVTNQLVHLKASLANQTNLLKQKTEQFDALHNELENTKELHANLRLEFDELQKLQKEGQEEMKQKQEQIIILQKSLEQHMTQLNETQAELKALNAQITSNADIRQMFKVIQKDLVSLKDNLKNQLIEQPNESKMFDTFTKIGEINQSEANKSAGNPQITNPIYCAGLLTAKVEELGDVKQTNKMLMKELFGVLQKSNELNTNRTTSNKNYIFPIFNKN